MINFIQYCWAIFIVVLYVLYEYIRGLLGKQRIAAIESRYIFITGCDTGFGHLAAKHFDKLGCHVIAGCLTERGEEELTKACSNRLKTVHLDVANHDSVVKAADVVKSLLPANTGLYGIINNAGILGPMLPAELIPFKNFADVFNVNCLGQVDVVKSLLPMMRLSLGGARIVNVASIAGRNALGNVSPYSISKYGIEAFSDSIRRELYRFGISVHIIEPGGHLTSITSTQEIQMKKAWEEASDEVRAQYGGDDYIKKRIDSVNPSSSSNVGNPQAVVDTFEHALFSRYPRYRYIVRWDAYMLLFIQWLPEWLGDLALRQMSWQ